MKRLSQILYSCISIICMTLPIYAAEGGAGQIKPLKVSTISVPVVQNDHIVTYVVMEFEIIPSSNQQGNKMNEFMARIRDRIFSDMYGVLGALWLPGFEVTPEFVLARVHRIIYELFPDEWVKEVKITRLITPQMPPRRS